MRLYLNIFGIFWNVLTYYDTRVERSIHPMQACLREVFELETRVSYDEQSQ